MNTLFYYEDLVSEEELRRFTDLFFELGPKYLPEELSDGAHRLWEFTPDNWQVVRATYEFRRHSPEPIGLGFGDIQVSFAIHGSLEFPHLCQPGFWVSHEALVVELDSRWDSELSFCTEGTLVTSNLVGRRY